MSMYYHVMLGELHLYTFILICIGEIAQVSISLLNVIYTFSFYSIYCSGLRQNFEKHYYYCVFLYLFVSGGIRFFNSCL